MAFKGTYTVQDMGECHYSTPAVDAVDFALALDMAVDASRFKVARVTLEDWTLDEKQRRGYVHNMRKARWTLEKALDAAKASKASDVALIEKRLQASSKVVQYAMACLMWSMDNLAEAKAKAGVSTSSQPARTPRASHASEAGRITIATGASAGETLNAMLMTFFDASRPDVDATMANRDSLIDWLMALDAFYVQPAYSEADQAILDARASIEALALPDVDKALILANMTPAPAAPAESVTIVWGRDLAAEAKAEAEAEALALAEAEALAAEAEALAEAEAKAEAAKAEAEALAEAAKAKAKAASEAKAKAEAEALARPASPVIDQIRATKAAKAKAEAEALAAQMAGDGVRVPAGEAPAGDAGQVTIDAEAAG